MIILKRKIKLFEQFIKKLEDSNENINDESEEEILPEPDPVPEEETPEEKDIVDEFYEYYERKNKK